MKTLVLCHGNINRSPLCAAILRSKGIDVRSAGFVNPGRRASKKIRDAATSIGRGLDLRAHRSQLLTKELYFWADGIITMDNGNLKRLREFIYINELAWQNIYPLGAFARPEMSRIPDPAFIRRDSQEFAAVVELIASATTTMANMIASGPLEAKYRFNMDVAKI